MIFQQGIPEEVVLQKFRVNTAWGHENLYPPNKVKNLVTIVRDQDAYYWRGWKNQKLFHTSGIVDMQGVYAYDLFVSEAADGFIMLIINDANANFICLGSRGSYYPKYIEVRQNDHGTTEWYTGSIIKDYDFLVPHFCRNKRRQPSNAFVSSTEPFLSDQIVYKEPILKRLLSAY